MKKATLISLKIYQLVISPFLHRLLGVGHACRYSPTCSEFATIHIVKEGVVIGGAKSIARIFYCHPFVKTLPKSLQQ